MAEFQATTKMRSPTGQIAYFRDYQVPIKKRQGWTVVSTSNQVREDNKAALEAKVISAKPDRDKFGYEIDEPTKTEIERKARKGIPLENPTPTSEQYYADYIRQLQREVERKALLGIPLSDPSNEDRFAQWFNSVGGASSSGTGGSFIVWIGVALVAILALK